ncbi:E3 ubiquitin-protein ligase MBR2-like [Carica papaya]|uniref:E3 ubiquitin-protein ligase MBR2-like n=1 Tax=Carica papaya TaxID=3649 RepID=UPI000B8C7A88|nr:E3 ubiquitin-protein ligase MBR2-like [Carica papaya]
MESGTLNFDATRLPPITDDREYLTVRLRVTPIYEGVFRHLEGRETVLNRLQFLPPTHTVLYLPIDLLSQSTAHHHILNQLTSFSLDNGLGNEFAEQISTEMLVYFQGISIAGSSNHFSFDARSVWTDVIFDEGVTGQRIQNFEEVLTYYRSNPAQAEFDFGGGNRDSSANNGVSTSLLEKLRAERRVDRTDACHAIEGPCAICLEDFLSAKELIDMPCCHMFHESCIFSWLKTKNSCPLCRQSVDL